MFIPLILVDVISFWFYLIYLLPNIFIANVSVTLYYIVIIFSVFLSMEGVVFFTYQFLQALRIKHVKVLLSQLENGKLQIEEFSKKQLFDILFIEYSLDYVAETNNVGSLRREGQVDDLRTIFEARLAEKRATK